MLQCKQKIAGLTFIAGMAVIIILAFAVKPISGGDQQAPETEGKIMTVVLDPGHGGRDPGAVGRGGIYEKNVVLGISLKTKQRREKKGFRVVMTRDKDVFVALTERAKIANRAKGDIFISIHANGSRKGGWGFETYFLSPTASDDEARKTAIRENSAAKLEVVKNGEPSSEVNSDLEAILFDMEQSEYLRESENLAVTIQDHLDAILKSPNRGVKQALFLVLVRAAMPAVLVEIGFVSSRRESKLLTSSKMQNRIATSICNSVSIFAKQRAIRMGLGKKSKSASAEGT